MTMRNQLLVLARLVIVSMAVVTIDGSSASPDCMINCWNNSKFVSSCPNEAECLCVDIGFQGAVFQCLYSQCHTAQLGSALHSALSECSSFEGPLELPLLIRQQGLQKREKRYPGSNSSATVRGSGFASASSMHSASYCHGSVSGLASPRTRSHGGSHSHAGSVPGFRTTASVKSTNVRTAMAISAPGFTATAY